MIDDPVKQGILELARTLWASDHLSFSDTARSRALREEILRNLLALAMTDDERAAMLGLPAGCRVRESAKIIAPQQLSCGEHVWIGENAVLDASGGLEIGAHTTISVGALVWSHASVLANLLLDNRSGNPWIARKKTTIGKGCYIGGPATIYPGLSIGDHAIVAPMSVVAEDVPAWTLVGGNPAVPIKQIDAAWMEAFRAKNDLPSLPVKGA